MGVSKLTDTNRAFAITLRSRDERTAAVGDIMKGYRCGRSDPAWWYICSDQEFKSAPSSRANQYTLMTDAEQSGLVGKAR